MMRAASPRSEHKQARRGQQNGEKGHSQEEVLLSPQLCLPAVVALLLRLRLHQVCSCEAEAVCLDDEAAAAGSD